MLVYVYKRQSVFIDWKKEASRERSDAGRKKILSRPPRGFTKRNGPWLIGVVAFLFLGIILLLYTGCRGQGCCNALPLQVHRTLGCVQPQTGRAAGWDHQTDATKATGEDLQEDQGRNGRHMKFMLNSRSSWWHRVRPQRISVCWNIPELRENKLKARSLRHTAVVVSATLGDAEDWKWRDYGAETSR